MRKGALLALGVAAALALTSQAALAGGDPAAGAQVFKKRCAVCHSVKPGVNKVGPSMAGVFGRKAGATDFKKYKGLKGADFVWNEENLDKWLKNPEKFLGKSTTMLVKLKNDKQRADVIAYLKTLE